MRPGPGALLPMISSAVAANEASVMANERSIVVILYEKAAGWGSGDDDGGRGRDDQHGGEEQRAGESEGRSAEISEAVGHGFYPFCSGRTVRRR